MRKNKWMEINMIIPSIGSERMHVLCTIFQHRVLPISLDAIVPNPPCHSPEPSQSQANEVVKFDLIFQQSVSRLLFGEKLYSVGLMVVNSSVREINMTIRSYLVRFTRFCNRESERTREREGEQSRRTINNKT